MVLKCTEVLSCLDKDILDYHLGPGAPNSQDYSLWSTASLHTIRYIGTYVVW